MLKRAGQAVGRHAFNFAHVFLEIAIGLVMVLLVAAGTLTYRLAHGPIHVDWLLRPTLVALNRQGPTQIAVGDMVLAWEGWRRSDQPVQLRAERITIFTPTPRGREVLAQFPYASVSLSLRNLLAGRVRPRRFTLEGTSVGVVRAADGRFSLNLGSLVQQGQSLSPSAELIALGLLGGKGVLADLREVRVLRAQIGITDSKSGRRWQIEGASLDLNRVGKGWHGSSVLPLAIQGRSPLPVRVEVDLVPSGSAHVTASVAADNPGAVGASLPGLSALGDVMAPLRIAASADLGRDFSLERFKLDLGLGEGRVIAGKDGVVPIHSAAATVQGAMSDMRLTALAVDLATPSGTSSVVTGTGEMIRDSRHVSGSMSLHVAHANAADLPAVWPEGLARITRAWVITHIPQGTAENLHLEGGFTGNADFTALAPAHIGGGLTGHDLTLFWLREMPPITQLEASLKLVDPTDVMIVLKSGRQQTGRPGSIALTSGSFLISGAGTPKPQGTLSIDGNGDVGDLLALLQRPALHLFEKHPLGFQNPSGMMHTHLDLGVPLAGSVPMSAIMIQGRLHATGVHLGQVADGQDLDHAVVDLTVDDDGLQAHGTGDYAQIPCMIAYSRDFRAGAASGIVQRVTATGTATTAQIAAMGYNPGGVLAGGTVGLAVDYQSTRADAGRLAIQADLTRTSVMPLFSFEKKAGTPARASGVLLFSGGKFADVPSFSANTQGFSVSGRAAVSGGHLSSVTVDRLNLGRNALAGVVTLPAAKGDPYGIKLDGETIDLSGEFNHVAPSNPPRDSGPSYVLDAHFAHALMANGQVLDDMLVHSQSSGGVTRAAELSFGANKDVTLSIQPGIEGRRLSIHAANAGALLLATDTLRDMKGGTLTLSGKYDDTTPLHALSGNVTIINCRISNAPAVTKLIQAMSGYGIFALAQGPGLGLSSLQTSFVYSGDTLTLKDGRAHSASIGFTASGTINLATTQMNLRGSVVPAYIFNNALSNLPLVGGLFSAEKGGGILAAEFRITGTHDDPRVTVNPLASLAPGFLRRLFSGI